MTFTEAEIFALELIFFVSFVGGFYGRELVRFYRLYKAFKKAK